ncbi:Na+/H+ antiporter subunit A [Schumannella luteola]
MLFLLVAFGLAALLVIPLTRVLGTRVFLVAALVPTAAFGWALVQSPAVLAGRVIEESFSWIPQLGLTLDVRLDTLSWVMALVVSGVGALVMVYCVRYFGDDEPALGRFAGVLLAFAGSMFGLVVADDVFLLFILWEATSVFSYLLIGHRTASKASRGAALQALLVTTFGGLVMLVGLVLLSVDAGTTSLSAIIGSADPAAPSTIVAVLLVLVGALSKSAIFPFHFWLPAAMAAPTPVSAYLHAAAMVKAGIYLIARLAPGFAEVPGWRESLVVLGVATMILGGWTALKQNDLKLVLAYGTVSQLGFLTVVVGFGTRDAALAGLALLLSHALFKATLFLVVGIIDHRTGTRDLRRLSGLGREMPVVATVTALALASMVGLPPLLGFVAKEAVLTSLLDGALELGFIGWVALVGVVLGSVLTVAYAGRYFWGAFATKSGVEPVRREREHPDFLVAPVLLAASGLALGLLAPLVDGCLSGYAAEFGEVEHPYHLALWHGFEPALGLSALTLALGAVLFVGRARMAATQDALSLRFSATEGYGITMRSIDRLAARTTSLTQRGSLPFYLGVIFLVFGGALTAALLLNRSWPTEIRVWDYPGQLAIGALMVVAAIAAVRATKRFQAVVLVGVTGFGMSALFALQGAPDLALTQILVEVVTLVAFVLVLRRLPARLGEKHASSHRLVRAAIGIGVGILMAVVAVVALGARTDQPISLDWPGLAYEEGHGLNVVNVALVDLRGWDTMGELSVIIAAATGVASLIFISTRTDNLPRVPRKAARKDLRARLIADPEQQERTSWLLAGRTLAARNRSILLEVVVRLIFHALIVVSLYVLLVGHNAPGGGFAGGLVAGMALVARYLAGGRVELGAAAPIDAGKLLGAGLLLAAGTALVPLFFGVDALTSTWFTIDLGMLGTLDFVTSTVFDIGVYLVVIGLVLDVLRSLGAEVDRQQEEEAGVSS